MENRNIPEQVAHGSAPTLAKLSLHLLGTPQILWEGRPLALGRRQTHALLYRLAVYLQPVTRDALYLLLWPDASADQARRNLARILYLLRRDLPDPALVLISGNLIQLDPARVWSDAAEVARLRAEAEPSVAMLERGVALFQGSFLAGFSLSGSAEFELWIEQERQFFEQQHRQCLARLVDIAARSAEVGRALTYAQSYLELDNMAEEIHRRLIQLYTAAGDRDAALRQYRTCAAILERELGVEPLPETQAAYQAALSRHTPPTIAPQRPAWTTLPSLDAPLVGRDGVLERLQRSLQQAGKGQGHALLIAGEAGIGKSRLLQEFTTRFQERARVLVGHAQPGEKTLPYQPLVQALRQGLHTLDANAPVAPIWLAEASLVLPELRTAYPDLPPPLQPDPNQARARLFESLLRLLLAMVPPQQPLLLCVDDLHWCDDTTLAWLAFLGRRLAGERILVIGAYRLEDAERVLELRRGWQRLGVVGEHHVAALDDQAIVQLLHHLDPSSTESPTDNLAIARRLRQASGGNTFFLLETLRAWMERDRCLPHATDLAHLPLADTVQETILERLQHLGPAARQVLEAGAILGLRFPLELVQQTAGRTEAETMDALEELARRYLLREGATGYAFHHDILRTVVEQNMTDWRRVRLHRRAAETLMQLHAHDLASVSRQIATHYDAAGLTEQAIPFYRRAAETALQTFAYPEAIQLLYKEVALLQALPGTAWREKQELDAQLLLGPALIAHKGYSAREVEAAYTRAWALAQQDQDPGQLFRALWGVWSSYMTGGQLQTALEVGQRLLDQARAEQNADHLLEARRALGSTNFHMGRLTVARDHFQHVLSLYQERSQVPHAAHYGGDPAVVSLVIGALAFWMLGYPDQAVALGRRGLEIADAVPGLAGSAHPFSQAFAHDFVAWLYQMRREPEIARSHAKRAIDLCSKNRFDQLLAMGMVINGWAGSDLGRSDEAIPQMEAGLDAWYATASGLGKPLWLYMLADACSKAGQTERALDLIAEALADMEVRDERRIEPELYRLRGDLLWRQEEDESAIESCYLQALDAARRQQAKSLELRAAIHLARLWRSQGRRDDARALVAEIYQWFSEGFDTLDLQEARALLDE